MKQGVSENIIILMIFVGVSKSSETVIIKAESFFSIYGSIFLAKENLLMMFYSAFVL